MWSLIQSEGQISLSDLKQLWTEHSQLNKGRLGFEEYREAMLKHKSIVRASHSLSKKGWITLEMTHPHGSEKQRIEKLLLTYKGFTEGVKYALPGENRPIALLTENSPDTIKVYNDEGIHIGTHIRTTS